MLEDYSDSFSNHVKDRYGDLPNQLIIKNKNTPSQLIFILNEQYNSIHKEGGYNKFREDYSIWVTNAVDDMSEKNLHKWFGKLIFDSDNAMQCCNNLIRKILNDNEEKDKLSKRLAFMYPRWGTIDFARFDNFEMVKKLGIQIPVELWEDARQKYTNNQDFTLNLHWAVLRSIKFQNYTEPVGTTFNEYDKKVFTNRLAVVISYIKDKESFYAYPTPNASDVFKLE